MHAGFGKRLRETGQSKDRNRTLGRLYRPPLQVLVAFIDKHKDQFGVEPICAVLCEHGTAIAPSTYYEKRSRLPSRRARRDEQLKLDIVKSRKENFDVYGARKTWLALNRQGTPVARCTIERLMRSLGLQGIRRGKKIRTTIADDQAGRPTDLVKRNFYPLAPNRLWVADITYVPTNSGTVYVAFVIDAYARRILGWKASTSMSTDLVLDALEMAVFTRAREGITDLGGLIHHTDAGSQYTSIALTTRLINAKVDPSVGTVGDCYDNALAESINGLYKTELIKPNRPWKNLQHVETETLHYVDWYNNRRLFEICGDIPPTELEQTYYRLHNTDEKRR